MEVGPINEKKGQTFVKRRPDFKKGALLRHTHRLEAFLVRQLFLKFQMKPGTHL